MSVLLTSKEIIDFTGLRTRAAQAEWLDRNNVKFYRRKGGGIVVTRADYERATVRNCGQFDLRPSIDDISSGKAGKCFSCKEAGIYLLWHEGEIVYVGRTSNVFSRTAKHQSDKAFDKVQFVKLPVAKHAVYEMELIKKLSPKYNVMGVESAPQTPFDAKNSTP